MKVPLVDKNADAEILFRDIRITDQRRGDELHSILACYVRMKIFTSRGKDKYGTLQIPYDSKTTVSDIAGRTITTDGTVVDLRRDAIFDQVAVRAHGLKIKVKSLAMPAVEPGAIIEYQWLENRQQSVNNMRLPLQFELPVERITYHIKPLELDFARYHVRVMAFNCEMPRPVSEPGDYHAITANNVPALHQEPMMPPEDQVKRWVLIRYEEDKNVSEDKFWESLGKEVYQEYKLDIKVNNEVRRIADAAAEGAKTPSDKIARLVDYCRKNLKDIDGDEITTEKREKAKHNNNTLDTLRRGQGNAYEINLAFAALAIAEGFDARFALIPRRDDLFFDKRRLTEQFFNSFDIAVNIDGKWQFYDAASRHVPVGMLRWQEEGVPALITDAKGPVFVETPLTPAEASRTAQIGEFTLDREGTLEGDVREILSGHEAIKWRSKFGSATTAYQEEDLRKDIKARFPDASITNVNFSGTEDSVLSVGFRYHIKIRGYAQRTGKRLLFVPNYFKIADLALFPESKREYPVYFEYPWSEFTSIRIKLPEDYALDHGDSPGGVNFAPVGKYNLRIGVSGDGWLSYQREFAFGSNGAILIPENNYPTLKSLFDVLHEQDSHMLTLKARVESASAGTP